MSRDGLDWWLLADRRLRLRDLACDGKHHEFICGRIDALHSQASGADLMLSSARHASSGAGLHVSDGPHRRLAIGAGSVLTPCPALGHLPAGTAHSSGITQIYEGTNQIQRVVMARQLLK